VNQRCDIIAQAPRVANAVADWAKAHTDIRGLALIVSHACGEARPDSDIDLMALALDPKTFGVDGAWPGAIAWPEMRLVKWGNERYGVVLDGFRVLDDPDGLMTRLCAECQQ
jgi:hypothetical protein